MYRILIVDDEPYVAEGLRVSLAEELDPESFELEVAFSSRDALARCRGRAFDILVSDIRMPEMDGLKLQDLLREEFPACRVIFLTGYGDFNLIRQAFRNQGTDYILKTEGDDQVLAAIRQACAHLEAERASQCRRLQEELLLDQARTMIGQRLMAQVAAGDLAEAGSALAALDSEGSLPQADGAFLVAVLRADPQPAAGGIPVDLALSLRLAEAALEGRARRIGAVTAEGQAVLLVQSPAAGQSAASLVRGALESAQDSTLSERGVTFSFVLGTFPVGFPALPDEIVRLRRALETRGGFSGVALAVEGGPAASIGGSRSAQLIGLVDRHIAENLSRDVSLSTLAGVAGLNPAYLSRLYVQETGCKLSERIAGLRYGRALELLADRDQKIADIARNVGFWTPSHFIRFFKKRTGLTPQAYRETPR